MPILKLFLKAAAVYGLPDFTVRSEQDTVTLQTRDKEDDTSNTYDQVVSGNADDEYTLDFKVENLKLFGMPSDNWGDKTYEVSVSSRMISEWKFSEFDLTYFIALEAVKNPLIPVMMFLGVIAATLAVIVAGYFHGHMSVQAVWHNLHNFH